MNPEDHRDQVEYHARRAAAAGRASDLDDHRQDGWLGLLIAAQRYDESGGANIKTFADRRIRGQILDGIRKRHPFGSTASRRHYDIPSFSLDAPGAPDIPAQIDMEAEIATTERAQAVGAVLNAMPDHHAKVLRMRYFDEIALEAVSRRLGFSKGYISRVHARALFMFRERWAKCARA